MKPYLTDEEIAHITKPLTQGAARVRWFLDHGYQATARPNGQPLVGRAHFDEVNAVRGPAANDAGGNLPNFEALRKRVSYVRGQKA